MRSFLACTGLIGLLVTTSGCGLTHLVAHKKASRTDSFSMPLASSGNYVITGGNGSIRCVAAEVSEVTVEAVITARGSTVEEAEANLDRVTIDRVETDGVIEISSNLPRGVRGGVSYRVTVPPDSSLRLQTSNGAIEAVGVEGNVKGVTSNGTAHVVNCLGEVDLKSSNGTLTIEGGLLTKLNARTSNGTVNLNAGLMPGPHEIHTSNGTIKAHLTGAPIVFTGSTSNGKITANGKKVKRGETVTLTMSDQPAPPSSEMANLSLRTSNGSIRVTHDG